MTISQTTLSSSAASTLIAALSLALLCSCPTPAPLAPTDFGIDYAVTGDVGEVRIRYVGEDVSRVDSVLATPPWSLTLSRPRDLSGHVYLCAQKETVQTDPEGFWDAIGLSIAVDGLEVASHTAEQWNGTVISVQADLAVLGAATR